MITTVKILGRWRAGRAAGREAEIIDVRAGNLVAVDADGALSFGDPRHFQAATGETGEALMRLLLPPPTTLELYRGAIRESLAALWSTAQIGHVDTRGWETCSDYIIDDGEGCMAIVQFVGHECVAAAYSDDPSRHYDPRPAIARMPAELRPIAAEIIALPFFAGPGGARQTSLFWSEAGVIVGAEPWPILYTYTGDILRRELLRDDAWRLEAREHYELPDEVMAEILGIAAHALLPPRPVPVPQRSLQLIIPPSAPHAAMVLEQAASDGVFRVTLS